MQHKTQQQAQQAQQGFTLIEVLSSIVIAITILFSLYQVVSLDNNIDQYRMAYAQAQQLVNRIYGGSGKNIDISQQQTVFGTGYQLRWTSDTAPVLQFYDRNRNLHRVQARLPRHSSQQSDKCLLYQSKEC